MLSSFHGINIATSALMAYQRAMDTVTHNVSNAANPGYSRQRVDLSSYGNALPSAGDMSTVLKWQIGGGVDVGGVTRARDQFLDTQFNSEVSRLGNWEALRDSLGRAEGIFSGLSDSGVASALDQYWNAWHDLSNQPESTAIRRQLVQRAQTVSMILNRNAEELVQERSSLNAQIGTTVTEVNRLANGIADLNRKIRDITIGGASPNDLLDQRDRMVEDMAKLTNITVRPAENNQVNIFIGSKAIVRDDHTFLLDATPDIVTGDQILTWTDDGSAAVFSGGQLKGLLDSRDIFIPRYQQKLDDFAAEIAASTNPIHAVGFALDGSTGNDFWVGTTAATIGVNPDLIATPQKVAASSIMNAPGNNDQALAILGLRDQKLLSGGTETLDSFLRSVAVDLGSDMNYAENMVVHQENLTIHLESRRAQISGVNIDEELAMMMQYQRSFQAAARMITAQDEMLDTIVNRLGLVGR